MSAGLLRAAQGQGKRMAQAGHEIGQSHDSAFAEPDEHQPVHSRADSRRLETFSVVSKKTCALRVPLQDQHCLLSGRTFLHRSLRLLRYRISLGEFLQLTR